MVDTSELYSAYSAAMTTTAGESNSGWARCIDSIHTQSWPPYYWQLQNTAILYEDGTPTWRVKNGYQLVYDGVPVSEIRETIKNRNIMDAINNLYGVPQKVDVSESQIMEIL